MSGTGLYHEDCCIMRCIADINAHGLDVLMDALMMIILPRRKFSSLMVSLGAIPRQVPWKDWDEWKEVKHLLDESTPGGLDKALEIINMWVSRGRIPIAIEATASIIEAMRGDVPSMTATSTGILTLSLAYGLAVCRFVNLITDLIQKGVSAASVDSLAGQVGIPPWIVQIRHTAAHGKSIPSLSILRRAAQYLLYDFIIPKYWDLQYTVADSQLHEKSPRKSNVSVDSLLRSFFGEQSELYADSISTIRTCIGPVSHWIGSNLGSISNMPNRDGEKLSQIYVSLESEHSKCDLLGELMRQGRSDLVLYLVSHYPGSRIEPMLLTMHSTQICPQWLLESSCLGDRTRITSTEKSDVASLYTGSNEVPELDRFS